MCIFVMIWGRRLFYLVISVCYRWLRVSLWALGMMLDSMCNLWDVGIAEISVILGVSVFFIYNITLFENHNWYVLLWWCGVAECSTWSYVFVADVLRGALWALGMMLDSMCNGWYVGIAEISVILGVSVFFIYNIKQFPNHNWYVLLSWFGVADCSTWS